MRRPRNARGERPGRAFARRVRAHVRFRRGTASRRGGKLEGEGEGEAVCGKHLAVDEAEQVILLAKGRGNRGSETGGAIYRALHLPMGLCKGDGRFLSSSRPLFPSGRAARATTISPFRRAPRKQNGKISEN